MEGRATALADRAVSRKKRISVGRLADNLRQFIGGRPQLTTVITAICAGVCLTCPALSTANAAPPTMSSPPTLLHRPIKGAEIPPPGSKLKLTTYLKGSKRFEQPLRILANRDNKLLDIWLPTGRLDISEEPFYETELHAPADRLSYRFVWYSPDGSTVTSPEYTVERGCRYPLAQVPADDAVYDSSERGEAAETERLFHISEALNREIIAYQEATRLLAELRTKITALQKTRESPAD